MTNWPQISISADQDYSHCFGCGQNNPIGLKLDFRRDGQTIRADFTPTGLHQGWPGMVHGGIIICLLDEAMGYACLFEDMISVTAEIQVQLKRLTPINQPLLITSSVTRKTRKLVKTKARVTLKDGTLVAEGTATQFVVDSQGNKLIEEKLKEREDGKVSGSD